MTAITEESGQLKLKKSPPKYYEDTRIDVKPSLWQKIKNSKFVRTIRYIMKIRVVLEFPALPEGRGE